MTNKNPYITGGGGSNYEAYVQTYFLAGMLLKSSIAGVDTGIIKSMTLQAKGLGYNTDDLVMEDDNGRHVICQIKHALKISKKQKAFVELVIDAWNDICSERFDKDKDIILLICGTDSSAVKDIKLMHDYAIGSVESRVFIDIKILNKGFSNERLRKRYHTIIDIIQNYLKRDLKGDEIHFFFKHFTALLLDIDSRNSSEWNTLSISLSHEFNYPGLGEALKIFVQDNNQTASTLTYEMVCNSLGLHEINNKENEIVSKMNYTPRSDFKGRDIEILTMHNSLISGNSHIFLYGLGAIGKTELAKAYAYRYSEEYDLIVFLDYENSLVETINDDSKLEILNLKRRWKNLGGNNTSYESDKEYFQRKIQILRNFSERARVLIIIDNYGPKFDKKIDLLIELKMHLIVTTRTDFEDRGYNCLLIKALSKDSQWELFRSIYRRRLTNEEQNIIKNILEEDLRGHTLAIHITALFMSHNRVSASEMHQILTNNQSANKIKLTDADVYNRMKSFFSLAGFEESYLSILTCLTLVPMSGIKTKLFIELNELKDYKNVNTLVEQRWIELEEESDRIFLHPIIRLIIISEANPNRSKTNDVYISGLGKHVRKLWSNSESYNKDPDYDRMVRYILKNYNLYTEHNLESFANFVDHLFFTENYSDAVYYARKVSDYAIANIGLENKVCREVIVRCADRCYNCGDFKDALYYLESCNGYIERKKLLIDDYERVLIAIRLARVYRNYYRIKDAIDSIRKAKGYIHEGIKKIIVSRYELERCRCEIANTCSDGIVDFLKGELDGLKTKEGVYNIYAASVFRTIAYSYVSQRNYLAAEEYYKKSLELETYYNRPRLIIANSNSKLGDVCALKGDFENAKVNYQIALEYRLNEFSESHPFVRNLLEKMEIVDRRIIVTDNLDLFCSPSDWG